MSYNHQKGNNIACIVALSGSSNYIYAFEFNLPVWDFVDISSMISKQENNSLPIISAGYIYPTAFGGGVRGMCEEEISEGLLHRMFYERRMTEILFKQERSSDLHVVLGAGLDT